MNTCTLYCCVLGRLVFFSTSFYFYSFILSTSLFALAATTLLCGVRAVRARFIHSNAVMQLLRRLCLRTHTHTQIERQRARESATLIRTGEHLSNAHIGAGAHCGGNQQQQQQQNWLLMPFVLLLLLLLPIASSCLCFISILFLFVCAHTGSSSLSNVAVSRSYKMFEILIG